MAPFSIMCATGDQVILLLSIPTLITGIYSTFSKGTQRIVLYAETWLCTTVSTFLKQRIIYMYYRDRHSNLLSVQAAI